ncbi:MAG: ABC transporter ATP-binding protein [Gordonia sp. (in: high G+C Gram-positive bacteria)]
MVVNPSTAGLAEHNHPRAGLTLLWDALRRNRGRLAVAGLLLSVHQLCELSIPVLIGVIIDRGVAHTDLPAMAGLLLALGAVFTALTIGYRFGARTAMRAAQDQAHRFRMDYVRAELIAESDAASPSGEQSGRHHRHGEIVSTANSDADEAGLLLRFLPQAFSALIALIAAAGALLTVDAALGLIVLVGVPLILSVVQLVAPLVTRRVGTQQAHIAFAAGLANDLITGLRPLRGIGGQSAALARYRHANLAARTAMRRAAIGHGVFFGTATGVTGILAVAVAILTGWFALTGRISIGELIAVLGIAQFLTEPLALIAMLPGRVASARASAQRLAATAAADARHSPTPLPIPAPAAAHTASATGSSADDVAVEFSMVTAGGIDGFDARVRAGECVVLHTSDASTATALIDLVTGNLAPTHGHVLINRVDATDIPDSLRPHTLLVEPHTVDLFAGTVWSNLSIAAHRSDHTRARALAILNAMGSIDIVGGTTAVEVLDIAVTDRGHSLSGGQRQRLALARALFTDPAILVLRDPTTAVDSLTEQTICTAVHRLRHEEVTDRTTVIVTDSPAWCAVADRIITVAEQQPGTVGAFNEIATPSEGGTQHS